MEALAILAFFMALAALLLAFLGLRRLGDLQVLEREVSELRERLRGLERTGASPATEDPELLRSQARERAQELTQALASEPPPLPPAPEPSPAEADLSAPPSEPEPARPRVRRIELERLLGVRGAALLGGLVMALAAILFFKHAFQQGWISPLARISAGVAWGFVLIGAGHVARRRQLGWVPGALEGAGLVALYASIWAASGQMYGYLSFPLAFALMVAVTAAGCFLALRGDSLLTAQVGLLGGFATPLLLSTGSMRPFSLFGYLLLLDVALLLMGRRRGWPSLGLMALLGTTLFQVLWFFPLSPAQGLAREALGWSGRDHELFGVALLLMFGLTFLLVGVRAATAGAELTQRARLGWRTVEFGGLATSGALALYLAVESELSAELWPTAALALVLAAGATFLGVRRDEPRAVLAGPLFGLALAGAWAADRPLGSAYVAWQLVGSLLGIALVSAAPQLLLRAAGDRARRASCAPAARLGFLGGAALLLVLAGGGTGDTWSEAAVGLPLLAPLYAGLLGMAVLGVVVARAGCAPDGPDPVALLLAGAAGVLPGLGLALRSLVAGTEDLAVGAGPWALVGLVVVPLALALVLRGAALAGALYSGLGLGAGLLALCPYLLVELGRPVGAAATAPDLGALVSAGLLPALALVLVVLLAAGLAARALAGSSRLSGGEAALLDGRLLAALAPGLLLLQVVYWDDLEVAVAYQWSLRATGGELGRALVLLLLAGPALLLWPSLHVRLLPGSEGGPVRAAGPWTWRLLGLTALVWVGLLRPLFEGATGLDFEREGLLVASFLLGLVVLLALRLAHRPEDERPWTAQAGLVSAVDWIGAVVALALAIFTMERVGEQEAITLLGGLSLGLAGLASLSRSRATLGVALAPYLLACLMATWGADSLHQRFSSWPVTNWMGYVTLVLVGVGALQLGVVRSLWEEAAGARRRLVPLLAGAMLAVVFVWLNLELSNHFDGPRWAVGEGNVRHPGFVLGGLPPRDLAMSITWALFALALLWVGSRRALGGLRWASLALVLASVTKVFLFDLAHLEGLYRVASLAGLALALLLVSVLYQRFVFARVPEPDEPAPE